MSATRPRRPSGRPRLAASERRASLLDIACRVFSEGSYRGTTTAEIARAAGVTEPILYRHFASKRDLYLECLTEAWARVRAIWDTAVAEEDDPALWHSSMARALRASEDHSVISHLWVQALVEASEDPEIAAFMRAHLREVHAYVADVMRRSQQAGGVLPDRDPDAEAWISLGIGLLRMVDLRIGGLVEGAEPDMRASRLRWLTGRE